MSGSDATTPTSAEPPAAPGASLDDRDLEPRTPMKRLGSTRKLAAFTNIRMQLCEQSRVLEARAEASAGVAGELHEYCRRRAELEAEYARALDKLARAGAQRGKERRDGWQHCGAAHCLQQALDGARALARDHAALAELYGGVLAARLQRAADDALRLHRRCRDIVLERHEELAAALAEAAAAGKALAAAAHDWRAAAAKLRHAHDQRERLAAADPPRPKKLKALDKELEKRRARHSEARARGLRARADYVLSLEAANATLQRYYLDDIAEIMMCMEVGFEAVVGRAVRTMSGAESRRAAAAAAAGGALAAAAEALDAAQERQRWLAAHPAPFALPAPQLGAPPERQDAELAALAGPAAPDHSAAQDAATTELRQRLVQLEAGARQLRAEVRESAKTLDAAEAELVRLMEAEPWDAAVPDEAARRDQEDYYLSKFRAYIAAAGRLARIEGRASAARARVPGAASSPPPSPPCRARPHRGQFAAPLGERLPQVLTSCVRVIALYGARHQGIFRVSGSQVEMQALRAAFERGEDPLARVSDANDINSVCGLLKLYLRSLRPPLLPPPLQAALLRSAAQREPQLFVRDVRAALAGLAQPALLVLRYLFAFLAHLTQYSASNMMDAWNLAICLGPTLLSVWGAEGATGGAGGAAGGSQVAQQNLANELVKRLIIHHAEIFPQDIAPHLLFTPPRAEDSPDGAGAPEPGPAAPAPDHEPAPDAHEDLSLYDDDVDDDDDEISEDGESGEWQEPHAEDRAAAERRADDLALGRGDACRLAETPDLVLDLPARAPAPCPSPAPEPAPAPAPAEPDAADNFVHNRDTLRKRSRAPEPAPAAGSPAPAPAPHGSPGPARHTALVCAKFAELTLTGGSLKPALAAKPALLRRPTPHPAHARPPPPPQPQPEPEPDVSG